MTTEETHGLAKKRDELQAQMKKATQQREVAREARAAERATGGGPKRKRGRVVHAVAPPRGLVADGSRAKMLNAMLQYGQIPCELATRLRPDNSQGTNERK